MNKNLPKVSVVTITYGHEKYIKETLDGVMMQQYSGPVEFIIANDNSPDATEEIVKKYFLENPAPSNFEIKYTKHAANKGMMPNFIWALEQATGKYIALCEGDDYWTDPLKLQKQVDFFEEYKECVFVFTAAISLRGTIEEEYFSNKLFTSGLVSKKLFLQNGGGNFATASVVFKKDDLLPIPPFFKNATAGDMFLALLAVTKGEIGYISDKTAAYRQMASNSWTASLTYEKYVEHYLTLQSLLGEFDLYTENRYTEITNMLRKSYTTNYIYMQLIHLPLKDSLITVFNNLSFKNDFRYNKQLIKTFVWRLLKRRKIFS